MNLYNYEICYSNVQSLFPSGNTLGSKEKYERNNGIHLSQRRNRQYNLGPSRHPAVKRILLAERLSDFGNKCLLAASWIDLY